MENGSCPGRRGAGRRVLSLRIIKLFTFLPVSSQNETRWMGKLMSRMEGREEGREAQCARGGGV